MSCSGHLSQATTSAESPGKRSFLECPECPVVRVKARTRNIADASIASSERLQVWLAQKGFLGVSLGEVERPGGERAIMVTLSGSSMFLLLNLTYHSDTLGPGERKWCHRERSPPLLTAARCDPNCVTSLDSSPPSQSLQQSVYLLPEKLCWLVSWLPHSRGEPSSPLIEGRVWRTPLEVAWKEPTEWELQLRDVFA